MALPAILRPYAFYTILLDSTDKVDRLAKV
jgi:hypothetical protein